MTYRLTPPDESFEPAEFAVFVTIPARKYRSRAIGEVIGR